MDSADPLNNAATSSLTPEGALTMSDVQQYLDQIQVGGEPPIVARRGRMPHPAAQALILKALEADPEWAHIDLGDSKTADARIPYLRKHKFEAAVRDTSVVWVRVTEETVVPPG